MDLITLMCKDLAYAQEHGINLPIHGLVYPIVLGNKGDWSWLVPVLSNLATLSHTDRSRYSSKRHVKKLFIGRIVKSLSFQCASLDCHLR